MTVLRLIFFDNRRADEEEKHHGQEKYKKVQVAVLMGGAQVVI